jgi:hypothetical protein
MTPEEINKLPTQKERNAAWIDRSLYDRYNNEDVLIALRQAFMRLPACPLLGVIGDAIQEIQYYRQELDDGK